MLNPCCNLGEQWKLFDSECLNAAASTSPAGLAQSFTWNTEQPGGPLQRPRDLDRSFERVPAEPAVPVRRKGHRHRGLRLGLRLSRRRDCTAPTTASPRRRAWKRGSQFNHPSGARNGSTAPALPQFYAEVAYNDLKVKIGHFYAPVGYEVVPTTGNFFPSLPYTFQYGEPFTHTGVLAT